MDEASVQYRVPAALPAPVNMAVAAPAHVAMPAPAPAPVSEPTVVPAVNGVQADPGNASPPDKPALTRLDIKRTHRDFIFGKTIGEGSFATVYLAKDIHNRKEYAIKVCDKRHIVREKKVLPVKQEKEVLNILGPCKHYFVKLFCTFQDSERLYFVLSYAKHGELLPYINKACRFDVACARFYAAEIVCALEYLKQYNIVHRDLKPENILLDENMHILITDFGSCKIVGAPVVVEEERPEASRVGCRRRSSFVGTAEYVSPELLRDTTATYSADLWALGCIVYQMICGETPFKAESEYTIFTKILQLIYEFPPDFDLVARDLVQKLLVRDPTQRLGATDVRGYPSIRAHPFFIDIDFSTLHSTRPPPTFPYNKEESYKVPDDLEAGLDDRQMTRLLGLDLQTPSSAPCIKKKISLDDLTDEEICMRLEMQQSDKWNAFVEGNLIVRQGLVEKKKGLFARRRMLLLTLGPHIYYVDPVANVLKGEIPWSADLRAEAKNFKTFLIFTPNRTYYLEDPAGYALEWCKAIDDVRMFTYGASAVSGQPSTSAAAAALAAVAGASSVAT